MVREHRIRNQLLTLLLFSAGQALTELGRFSEATASWQQAIDHLLKEENCAAFDLSIFVQLKQLIKAQLQTEDPASSPLPTESTLSAATNRQAPLTNSVQDSEASSPAKPVSAEAGSGLENAPTLLEEVSDSSLAGPSVDVESASRQLHASVESRIGEKDISAPSSAESKQSEDVADPNAFNTSAVKEQGLPMDDTTSTSNQSSQPNGHTTQQKEPKPEPPPNKASDKPPSETSRDRTSEGPPNGKPNGRGAASPSRGTGKGQKAEPAPETNRTSGSGASSSRGASRSRRKDCEAGSRSGGDASCSGREERAGKRRAEIWGAISRDRRDESREAARPREDENGDPQRKAKKDVELPPKVIVNGMDWRVQKGIQEVNAGELENGIAIFDKVSEA